MNKEIKDETPPFKDWFYIVTYHLREVLKYEGEINEKYFRFDYDEKINAQEAAQNFIGQLNK